MTWPAKSAARAAGSSHPGTSTKVHFFAEFCDAIEIFSGRSPVFGYNPSPSVPLRRLTGVRIEARPQKEVGSRSACVALHCVNLEQVSWTLTYYS